MRIDRRLGGSLISFWLLALPACSSESNQPERPLPAAGAVPNAPTLPVAQSLPREELGHELRARVSQLPAFTRLPASDQAWVLAKAAARVKDANARELEPLVQQLAEVRQFAVAEREEPMRAPSSDAGEVP